MNKRIIYQVAGGGVAVIIPAAGSELTIEEIAAKDVPAGVAFEIVDVSELPADRTFRGAWVAHPETKIAVDFTKAQAITANRLRAERMPLFEKLDADFMKAMESGASTAAIVAEKVRLRDLPVKAAQATTLDELKALKAAP